MPIASDSRNIKSLEHRTVKQCCVSQPRNLEIGIHCRIDHSINFVLKQQELTGNKALWCFAGLNAAQVFKPSVGGKVW